MPGIAITDADGFELTDAEGIVLDESCASECPVCGAECFLFARFEPCTVTSPDPACDPPPGAPGVIYICNDALCTADSPYRPGEPFPPIGLNLLVIWYEGRCWRKTGGLTRPELPADAVVIEAGNFRCMGQQCNDNPDCGTLQYAEAVPCDPSVPRPWPIYCPAGLPISCSAINPALYMSVPYPHWNTCFVFDRNAPVIEAPPDTPIIILPSTVPDGVSCCDCTLGCNRTGPIASLYRPGVTFPGCCCGNLAGASIRLTGNSYGEGVTIGFGNPYINLREWFDWDGTIDQNNGSITINRRRQELNEAGQVTSDVNDSFQLGIGGLACPLNINHVVNPSAAADPSPAFDQFGTGSEIRTCTRLDVSWSGNFGMNPFTQPYGAAFRFTSRARLVGMVTQAGCGNDNCSSGVRYRPPVGQAPPGTLEPTGGGGMVVAGCSGCGDGMGW